MHSSQDQGLGISGSKYHRVFEEYQKRAQSEISQRIPDSILSCKYDNPEDLAKEIYVFIIGGSPDNEEYAPQNICAMKLSYFEHALRLALNELGYDEANRLNGRQFDVVTPENMLYSCTTCDSVSDPSCTKDKRDKLVLGRSLSKNSPHAQAQYSRIMNALGLEPKTYQ